MAEPSARICYVEEVREGFVAPVGYQHRSVSEPDTTRAMVTFRRKPSVQRMIVYKEQCHLSLDHLEVVSFVQGNLATGYVCSCDLTLAVTDPGLLLADLVSEERVVTQQNLDDRVRPRVTEILKDLGGSHSLENRASWPDVCASIEQRLDVPRGVEPATFSLRDAQCFEKRIEEVRLIEGFRTRLDDAIRDGKVARALAEGRVEECLAELGEQRARSLLTRGERQRPVEDRLERYLAMLGLQLADLQTQGMQIHRDVVGIMDRVVKVVAQIEKRSERERRKWARRKPARPGAQPDGTTEPGSDRSAGKLVPADPSGRVCLRLVLQATSVLPPDRAAPARNWWDCDPKRYADEMRLLGQVLLDCKAQDGVEWPGVRVVAGRLRQSHAFAAVAAVLFPCDYPSEPPVIELRDSDGRGWFWQVDSGWRSEYAVADVLKILLQNLSRKSVPR